MASNNPVPKSKFGVVFQYAQSVKSGVISATSMVVDSNIARTNWRQGLKLKNVPHPETDLAILPPDSKTLANYQNAKRDYDGIDATLSDMATSKWEKFEKDQKSAEAAVANFDQAIENAQKDIEAEVVRRSKLPNEIRAKVTPPPSESDVALIAKEAPEPGAVSKAREELDRQLKALINGRGDPHGAYAVLEKSAHLAAGEAGKAVEALAKAVETEKERRAKAVEDLEAKRPGLPTGEQLALLPADDKAGEAYSGAGDTARKAMQSLNDALARPSDEFAKAQKTAAKAVEDLSDAVSKVNDAILVETKRRQENTQSVQNDAPKSRELPEGGGMLPGDHKAVAAFGSGNEALKKALDGLEKSANASYEDYESASQLAKESLKTWKSNADAVLKAVQTETDRRQSARKGVLVSFDVAETNASVTRNVKLKERYTTAKEGYQKALDGLDLKMNGPAADFEDAFGLAQGAHKKIQQEMSSLAGSVKEQLAKERKERRAALDPVEKAPSQPEVSLLDANDERRKGYERLVTEHGRQVTAYDKLLKNDQAKEDELKIAENAALDSRKNLDEACLALKQAIADEKSNRKEVYEELSAKIDLPVEDGLALLPKEDQERYRKALSVHQKGLADLQKVADSASAQYRKVEATAREARKALVSTVSDVGEKANSKWLEALPRFVEELDGKLEALKSGLQKMGHRNADHYGKVVDQERERLRNTDNYKSVRIQFERSLRDVLQQMELDLKDGKIGVAALSVEKVRAKEAYPNIVKSQAVVVEKMMSDLKGAVPTSIEDIEKLRVDCNRKLADLAKDVFGATGQKLRPRSWVATAGATAGRMMPTAMKRISQAQIDESERVFRGAGAKERTSPRRGWTHIHIGGDYSDNLLLHTGTNIVVGFLGHMSTASKDKENVAASEKLMDDFVEGNAVAVAILGRDLYEIED
ncbi:MAG: hypothetical protein AB7Q97_04880 [Gammaproteobacteria bacterium]